MCGITGFCDFSKRLTRENLIKATDVLQHRGPDSGNAAAFETVTANIGVGHRRLSILDVSTNGSQPMYSDDKKVVIILNGEVYNFKEIRKELEGLGHSFHSNSDTEVIIKAYQQYGINSVHRFIGMFAFALYDIENQVMYLLRDRAGVKPLYYFYKNDCLLFSSELKSIYTYPLFEKNINEVGISLFFKYAYIRAPHTIFKDTFKVKPGHYIKVDIAKKKIEDIKYYNVLDFYNKPKLTISEEDATSELERLFISAFQYRMVSDVPVGVFLSGGYDSGVVAAILQKNNTQKIKTFTIGFNVDKYNEAPYAKKMAEYMGTDHHEHYCTTNEALDILPTLAEIYDEPFGDSSAIPTTLVSQFARKHVTVSLSADGGDEIFAGYDRYSFLSKINDAMSTINRLPDFLIDAGKAVAKFSSNILPPGKAKVNSWRLSEMLENSSHQNVSDIFSQHFNSQQLNKFLNRRNPKIGLYDDIATISLDNNFVNTCLALDYNSYMVDDILVKVDRATMSVGLEGREPLLDNRIIEFVSQLPSELKYYKGEKKYILKKIAHKYLPREIMHRHKAGFSVPLAQWLRNELKDYLYEYINESQLSKHGFIDIKKAIGIRDSFLSGKDSSRNTSMASTSVPDVVE